jgi:paraquat-inducible protein B
MENTNMSEQDGARPPASSSAPGPLPPAAGPGDPRAPKPAIDRPSRWLPSLIWLIPVLAAVIGAWQVALWMGNRGPTITVTFATGEGLEAGKTQVKFRDVDIGKVVAVRLGEDASRVVAEIQMAKEARRFTAEDSRFWVVRPQIGAGGVSGLNTLLSGAYIGAAPGVSEETKNAFVGLETPPAVPYGLKGREYRLHADSLGSVAPGSPVYYRRVRVGQVASVTLDASGKGIDMSAFVEDKYTALVGPDTRWFHASGVDLRLDANGLKLNTQSLAALATGGIAFESVDGGKPAAPAPAGAHFVLAEDRTAALRPPDGPPVSAVLYFDGSLRGLAVGAPVDFRGIALGEVRSIGVEFDRERRKLNMPVTVDLYPGRLGQSFLETLNSTTGGDALGQMVGRGLRGQLKNGNLLTGQLYVALDFHRNAPKAQLTMKAGQLVFPTVPGQLDELQTQVANIARKLDKIPFDEIGNNLNKTLVQANALIARLDGQVLPEMKDTLTAAKQTFASAESLLSQDAPLQSDLRRALQEVTDTMEKLNDLADYLERHPESLIRGKPQEKK